MTRPIPIFRFIFTAYYATSNKWEFEDENDFSRSDRLAEPNSPPLKLVVDNDVVATARTGVSLREEARGGKKE